VDTRMAFPGKYCQDKAGNKYPFQEEHDAPAQETSCCQCLEYTCRPVFWCDFECDYKDESEQEKCEQKRKECEEMRERKETNELYVYWMTTVSEHCCLYCNNTVYKADTVIDTTQLEDKCESEETHVCRKIPGEKKAKIESEFRYGFCCNDDVGLQPVETTALQPSTCSKRECVRFEDTPFAVWISRPIPGLKGCDCCKVYDEDEEILIEDKGEITINGETFECCRGELVKKVEQKGKKAQEKEFNKE